jgi:hypothetical protein
MNWIEPILGQAGHEEIPAHRFPCPPAHVLAQVGILDELGQVVLLA